MKREPDRAVDGFARDEPWALQQAIVSNLDVNQHRVYTVERRPLFNPSANMFSPGYLSFALFTLYWRAFSRAKLLGNPRASRRAHPHAMRKSGSALSDVTSRPFGRSLPSSFSAICSGVRL
jgi:hypothetical protein